MKPFASLSLDLDNKWSYLKVHGDAGWQSFPSYLDIVVPRILDFLKARNLTITVFIVGQDAALSKNSESLAAIAAAGHEIGNHSFRHEPWLHRYTLSELQEEIASAEEQIARVTGQRPTGFRGPGFSWSPPLLEILARRGYSYDASMFPTFLGPLARAYYFMTSNLTAEEKLQRGELFGGWKDGLWPLKPYRWNLNNCQLMEIPVTTLPFFKIPFHASYLLYLSVFSPLLAIWYLRAALALCRITGTSPSLLLHPLDFLGCDDNLDLSFFPAMNLPSVKKLDLLDHVLRLLAGQFEVVSLGRFAIEADRRAGLPMVKSKL